MKGETITELILDLSANHAKIILPILTIKITFQTKKG